MRAHASHDLNLLTSPGVWLCALAAAFTMATAHAANTPEDLSVPSDSASLTPKQAYEHDKAYCNSREKTEDRATCMKEASRAYQEAKAGILEPGSHVATRSHRARHMARTHNDDQATTSGTSSSKP